MGPLLKNIAFMNKFYREWGTDRPVMAPIVWTGREIVLKANRGVVFKFLSKSDQWLKVLHESGENGWVHGDLVGRG